MMTPEAQNSHAAFELLSAHTKVTIDWMKHLMSLSIGTIVVVATFHDRISKNAFMVWTLPLSIICLLLSILCAMRVSFDLVYNDLHTTTLRIFSLTGNVTEQQMQSMGKSHAQAVKREEGLKRYLFSTNLTFAAGVVALVLFVVRNFFS